MYTLVLFLVYKNIEKNLLNFIFMILGTLAFYVLKEKDCLEIVRGNILFPSADYVTLLFLPFLFCSSSLFSLILSLSLHLLFLLSHLLLAHPTGCH